jgi:hypothetical protein
VATGIVRNGRPVSWTLWGYVSVYFIAPLLLAWVRGIYWDSLKQSREIGWLRSALRSLTTIKPPTGWDHLFGQKPQGWIKMKLKSGAWIGGWFGIASGTDAFAGGYPHPRELYMPQTVEIDQASGKFVVDERGRPYELGPGILVRWEDVEYLKFTEVG